MSSAAANQGLRLQLDKEASEWAFITHFIAKTRA
jgi:hypothetical protein